METGKNYLVVMNWGNLKVPAITLFSSTTDPLDIVCGTLELDIEMASGSMTTTTVYATMPTSNLPYVGDSGEPNTIG